MALTISATDVELQKPINVIFEQTFLRRAQQVCPYLMGTVAGQISKQQGTSTIKWRRIEQLSPSTTALPELTTDASYMQGRNAAAASFTDAVATVQKYGQFYICNEEVDIYNPNGTTDQLMATLGEAAGRSLNQLMRDVMEDDATQRFANNVANIAAVKAIVSTGDLNRIVNELSRNSTQPFTPMTSGSQNIGTAPILRSYWGICHPDVAHDVVGLSGFVGVEKYAGQTAVTTGEFGFYGRAGVGIRFVQTEDAQIDSGAGAALSGEDVRGSSNADVYTICIYGENAFGSVGLGRRHTDGVYRAGDNVGGWEIIYKERGSGGTSDPFNEISTLAYKFFFAGKALNSNWSRALRCAATRLDN